mmetsp:Transcript_17668/g.30301  ORF Transcript_17668/g.30301 Transcript_17668/m.30301 type:complete len:216 (-) Transcript_17668:705-1352(-)
MLGFGRCCGPSSQQGSGPSSCPCIPSPVPTGSGRTSAACDGAAGDDAAARGCGNGCTGCAGCAGCVSCCCPCCVSCSWPCCWSCCCCCRCPARRCRSRSTRANAARQTASTADSWSTVSRMYANNSMTPAACSQLHAYSSTRIRVREGIARAINAVQDPRMLVCGGRSDHRPSQTCAYALGNSGSILAHTLCSESHVRAQCTASPASLFVCSAIS